MQTTLNIDETIVERLYAEAKRRGTTVSALAEAGILNILDAIPKEATPNKEELYRVMDADDGQPPPETAEELMERLPKWQGGELLVDISDKEELRRVMDEYDGF